jgi:hypothetical protein
MRAMLLAAPRIYEISEHQFPLLCCRKQPHADWKHNRMSDTVQALLDSGALYLAVGAVICLVLGVGAAKRMFQGGSKIKTTQQ